MACIKCSCLTILIFFSIPGLIFQVNHLADRHDQNSAGFKQFSIPTLHFTCISSLPDVFFSPSLDINRNI